MKYISRSLLFVLVLLALALPSFTQGRPASSDRGSNPGTGVASSPAPSPAPITTNTTSYSSREVSSPRGSYAAGAVSPVSGRAYAPPPRLQGTSFSSVGTYYQWQDFYYYLQMRYMINGLYFDRFYHNVEPLVTPQLLKLTTREPLRLSMQMVTAVDELEAMLQARRDGNSVSKQDITAKAQEIRDLAKHIRTDPALSFVDQRKEKDVLKGNNIESMGLEAIGQLREMVTDLNTQLKGMYMQRTTSTVSVNSLTQPSLESLSRGIEKVSRVIENSAKKI